MAENTLRRIWGRLKGYQTVFIRTLDVLSRYAGFSHWDSFCNHIKTNGHRESGLIRGNSIITVEDLRPGDRISIGWLPDRLCIVEFQGGRIFKAIECKNSTLQDGDSFECSIIIKNYPFFVDNLVHGGEICEKQECMEKASISFKNDDIFRLFFDSYPKLKRKVLAGNCFAWFRHLHWAWKVIIIFLTLMIIISIYQ